ncbi:transglutaminase family protein [Geoalkalibacter sp.]|uniref:transglutaminase family protein n=1 Tax=Geoalkalibacter sp. TaxID=3041440 RepID=UPI00272DE1F8|nr:transglutaminase family protein [Geoalkalibacter sp.]
MKYRVTHTTELIYEARAGLSYNLARLMPRQLPAQNVLGANLRIVPAPQDHLRGLDYFGNHTDYFSLQQPHETLRVTAVSEIEALPREAGLFDEAQQLSWELARERLRADRGAAGIDALQFTLDSPMIVVEEFLAEYARPSFGPGRLLEEAVQDLMGRIHQEFKYDPEFSSIATPLEEVMAHRKGVCQDFAHLAIGCLRALGLAARYVSGYLETDPPPGKERLVGADASHAWFSVYHPGRGWLDFDPTNNQQPAERYVTVAWGRDFADVTPLKGVAYGGGDHELKVAVDVERLK